MRHLTVYLILLGAVTWLGAGCGEKPPEPKATKAKAPAPKRPVDKPLIQERKPVRPAKVIVPGQAGFLDSKNGFRDASLGDSPSKFSNLVLVTKDEARELETYTRTGDVLSIEKTPLTTIEYSFFRGQLAWVTLKWRMEFNSQDGQPLKSDMDAYCTALYGPPKKQSGKNEQTDVSMTWEGRRARIVLNESRLPGVPDVIRSRWGIPPTTFGELMIESVELRQAYANAGNKLLHPQNGL